MTNFFQSNLKFLRKQSGVNQTEIALQLNKAHTSIGNYEKGISEPTISEINILSQFFDISIENLINTDLSNSKDFKNYDRNIESINSKENSKGKGKDLPKHSPKDTRMPQVITMDTQGNENVVFVPVKARAGYLNGYGDSEFISQLPAYRLPGLNNGTFRLFEADGLSMYPTLHSGDVIIGSFVESLAALRDDRVHIVVTKNDGVVVKRVLNRIKTDGKLILKSDNYKERDQYPTLVVSPDDILEVWYATGFLSRQMRPPAEMYNRLIDLEGKFTLMEEKLKKVSQ
ncbi:MAG: LexA family transcriptional regulator [Bacteroidetes bacterium]|nr:LexA family transcriptional regulator [Bacteroidota bacterium]